MSASISDAAIAEAVAFARTLTAPQPDLWERFCWLDEQLVRAGWPATSPWWRGEVQRFYRGTALRKCWRVGRRGGKSTTLCRCAVIEALWGGHDVPPGDCGEYVIVSIRDVDAKRRLDTICAILDAVGIRYHPNKAEKAVWLPGRNVMFRALVASNASVGQTCIGILADEMAKWKNEAGASNPAKEVMSSLRPAMATMPRAREHASSSPWSTLDYHYELFELGETPQQQVAHAATWTANPTLTPERCRELTPDDGEEAIDGHDDATFDREYGAIPMRSSAVVFYDHDSIEAAVRDYVMPRVGLVGETVTAGGDFAFARNSSALTIAHRYAPIIEGEDAPESPHATYHVAELLELRPVAGPLVPSEVCGKFAARMRHHGAPSVMADAWYREAIVEYLKEFHLAFADAPASPAVAHVRARILLHSERLVLPRNKRLIQNLREVRSKPTANGSITMVLPQKSDGSHADDVASLVLACYQRGGRVVAAAPVARPGWSKADLDALKRSERDDDGRKRVRNWR